MIQLVLVEGPNWRNPEKEQIGKIDRCHRVSFHSIPVLNIVEPDREQSIPEDDDYVEIHMVISRRASLSGEALVRITLSAFYS